MRKQKPSRRNADQWQKIINEQESSGQSAAAYCRKQGLSEKSFYAWRSRLAQRISPHDQAFVEVSSSMEKSDKEALRITTPDGYCVEVSAGTEAKFVKEIIGALK